jgi:hypothetical protein
MIAPAALVTFTIVTVLIVVLLERLKFLIPYKGYVFHAYGQQLAIFTLMLFLNVFAIVFAALRRFRLKNTGQKLLHLDKQVKSGQSALSREIAERYEE